MELDISSLFSSSMEYGERIERDIFEANRELLEAVQNKFRREQEEGYDTLAKNLRAWSKSHERKEDIQAVIDVANDIRENFEAEAFVVVGIGGSDLGTRTIHQALNPWYHNLMSREERGNAPMLFFTGDSFDPAPLYNLLQMLKSRGILDRTIFNVISKSGTTTETVAAFLIIKDFLEKHLRKRGIGEEHYAEQIVATTGLNRKSVLYTLNEKQRIKFRAMLPVPDGVGGRFSFASPVGLLTLAVSANDRKESVETRVKNAMQGLKDGEKDLYSDVFDRRNIAYQLALINKMYEEKGKNIIAVSYTHLTLPTN